MSICQIRPASGSSPNAFTFRAWIFADWARAFTVDLDGPVMCSISSLSAIHVVMRHPFYMTDDNNDNIDIIDNTDMTRRGA